jgi:CheY-like chemotaxis protein
VPEGHKAPVLIAEDDPDIATLIELIFEREGQEVVRVPWSSCMTGSACSRRSSSEPTMATRPLGCSTENKKNLSGYNVVPVELIDVGDKVVRWLR